MILLILSISISGKMICSRDTQSIIAFAVELAADSVEIPDPGKGNINEPIHETHTYYHGVRVTFTPIGIPFLSLKFEISLVEKV